MKLKPGFIFEKVCGMNVAVSNNIDDQTQKMLNCNDTAYDILQLLKEDTTPERIVDEMVTKYDAPRQVIADDLNQILTELRSNNLLIE